MYKKLILIIIIAVLTFPNKNNGNNHSLLPPHVAGSYVHLSEMFIA